MQSAGNVIPDFNRQLLQRAQIGALNAQTQESQAQAQAIADKQARLVQLQKDLAASDGSPTSISRLIMRNPEFADQLKAGWDVSDKATTQADLTNLGEMYSSALGGDWKSVAGMVHARHDAEQAAGRANPQYSGTILDIADKAADGDPQAQKIAKTMLGSMIAAKTGPDHFSSTYDKLNPSDSYTLDAGAARFQDNKMVAHSPFIIDGDKNVRLWTDNGTAPAAGGAPAAQGGFDNAVAQVLSNEGGYNPKDMNGAPVNFGINAKANADELKKLGVSDIKNLTRDQAVQIYRDKYWAQSGAENLPANLQTPYFDVYVRNPKIAKKALADSGGDPARFVQLTSAYFQNLAQKPSGQPYGKAWAARDATNMAIATGQATAQTTQGGGGQFPIVIPGNSPDQYHALTPAEVQQRGLDPSQQYQLNTKTGQVTGLGQRDAAGDDILKQYNIGPNETGPSVLQKLPASLASQVKALSEGRLPMPSSFALAKPYWQKMLQLTAQYDPTFDAANAPARKAAITAFTGNGRAAQTVGSVNRVANHLETLWQANKKLAGPDTGFGPLNTVLATAGQAFDPDDAKAYDTAVGFIAGELEKIARNSPGTEAGVDRVVKNLNRHNSSSTREAAIKTAVEIISGAIDPLKEQYNSAFTNGATRPNIPWVTPRAQKIYRQIGGVDMSLTGANANTNSDSDGNNVESKVLNGKTYYRINGKWFDNPGGR
jgi:hypothetical protein